MKYGIDISSYQRNVNYDEVVKSIDFAILRIGYGVQYRLDQRDSELDNHYNGLKGKIPLGAYYYAYATNYEQGRKEAENCLSYIGDKTFELPIYYDLEESRNTKEAGQGFVDRIREEGLVVGIYASSSFYNEKGLSAINYDSLWIANYGSNNGQIPSRKPTVNYDIWQYTSEGRVNGINGNVDMNITNDDVPTPTPTPGGNEQIKDIQNWVNTYGTDIAVDGIFGPNTKKAIVKVYQTELNRQFNAGLVVDGIWGTNTRNATRTVKRGARGNITKSIQAMLICKGYNTNGFDGIYGSGTENAVKSFQRNNELSVDGIFGKNTGAKLFS